jgi:hypothetical protein
VGLEGSESGHTARASGAHDRILSTGLVASALEGRLLSARAGGFAGADTLAFGAATAGCRDGHDAVVVWRLVGLKEWLWCSWEMIPDCGKFVWLGIVGKLEYFILELHRGATQVSLPINNSPALIG